MRTATRLRMLVGTALLALPGGAAAQVFTPTFQAPMASNDIGIYLVDMGDLGIEGIYRRTFGRGSDLGLRLGFADAELGDVLLVGADLRTPLQLGATAPLAAAFTVGAQAALLDGDGFGLQGGISLGYAFRSPQVSFTPYIHPRLALVNQNDESDLEVEADLGLDVAVTRSVELRFGANLGDGADWGIGVAFRS